MFRFGMPRAKLIKTASLLKAKDKISIIIPEKNLPLKFYPEVVSVDDKTLVLQLPDACWQLVDVEEGLKFLIIKSIRDKLFYTEGHIKAVDRKQAPGVTLRHCNNAVSVERRLFYRFDIRRYFKLEKVVFPDGRIEAVVNGVCLDLSPGGLGFKTKMKLLRGTRFAPGDLFGPVVSTMDGTDYCMEVIWSKGNRLTGYKNGAVFKFTTKKEQDRFDWVIDQLQINRLSWHYRNLVDYGKSDTC